MTFLLPGRPTIAVDREDFRRLKEIVSSDSFGLTQLIPLLERDVVRTLGPRYAFIVHDAAANVDKLGIAARCEKLVEDVQQYFHDAFVNTTWPQCPHHPAHPLGYRDGAWWCERDGIPIAQVGDLPAPAKQ